ncbi:DMT family transporter [Chitinimonas lacunae]|uniref:DMT family transporter n=1 Tax=Chitinimonas lacunae TaxID=1963018 RepID=A0ABV8MW74_9NEIS
MNPLFPAHLAMLLWAVLIAVSFPAAAQVDRSLDAVVLTALRLLLSALLFLPFLLRRGLPSPRAAGAHLLLGSLLAIYFACLFEALKYTSATDTALLYALVPLFTLGAERLLLPAPSSLLRFIAMLPAAFGAMLIISQGGTAGAALFDYPHGVFLLGCVAMALYSPLSKRLAEGALQGRQPAEVAAWNMLAGAALLFLFCFSKGRAGDLLRLRLLDWCWILYLALFATLVTFALLHFAIGTIPPATVLSYSYLSTLLVAMAHWTLQSPSTLELLGGLLIVAGMVGLVGLSTRTPRCKPYSIQAQAKGLGQPVTVRK